MTGKWVTHTEEHVVTHSKRGHGPMLQFTTVYGFVPDATEGGSAVGQERLTKMTKCVARQNVKTGEMEWTPCLHWLPHKAARTASKSNLGFPSNYKQFTTVTQPISDDVLKSLRVSGATDLYLAEYDIWKEEQDRLLEQKLMHDAMRKPIHPEGDTLVMEE